MVSTAAAFATDGSHLQRRLESLINPVGYYTLHPDVSLNYQMNRFSTGETDMIDEMRDVAPRIHDYTDYTREFVGLARRALDSGRKLEGGCICGPPSSSCSATTRGNKPPGAPISS